MSKPAFTCVVCNKQLHPKDPGVKLVAHTADGPMYRHGGACEEVAEQRRLNTDQCRHCRKGFQRHSDPHRPGRRAEYCGDSCRKAAGRASAALWRAAARGDLPDSVDETRQRINAAGALFRDLRAGRFNGSTPSAARDTLIGYTRALERHEVELVRAQRADAQRQRAEAMREAVGARRKADEDSWAIFLASQDEESK